MWLDFIDCGEYKIAFIENSISGQELFDLEDDDLLTIGVKKLGLRKKILSEIKTLHNKRGFDSFFSFFLLVAVVVCILCVCMPFFLSELFTVCCFFL